MNRCSIPLLLFLTLPGLAAAEFKPDLSSLDSVPLQTLSQPNVQKALAQVSTKQSPFQFAVGIRAGTSLRNGRWTTLDPHTLAWRMRIGSAGAKSLSLHFAPFELPASASVWIYDLAGKQIYGPYTAAESTPEGLWTPTIQGEEVVAEVHVGAADAGLVRLGIADAYHGYRDAKDATVTTAKSGSCNVDVACPEGAAWQNEIRSVARVEFGNNARFLCSGELLNNVRQNQDRLFLTADHCEIGEDQNPASSAVFYFNYQAAACGGPRSDLNNANTLSGATFLADDVQSDFTLLRINQPIPSSYKVYFAGWNATGQGSDKGVSIHHPGGDDKAISVYDTPVSKASVDIGSACAIDAWQVQWSSGTTEQGSSGGGLWNSSHELIGVLSGGSASCTNPSGADYFARFERGWTANPDPQGQLKAWLDPDNTCIAQIPGLDSSTANAGPVTSGPRLCQGPASDCAASGHGGGGSWTTLISLLLSAGAIGRALMRSRRNS